MARRVIRDNRSFFEGYKDLATGDIIVGRIRLHPGEEHLLLDLLTRGIVLIPSASSQLLSRSKVFQARVLDGFMMPGTSAVYSLNDLMRIISDYGNQNVGRVVCKLDRANAGMGILLYTSIEEIYSHAVLGALAFPFVVQPYLDDCRDVRVVMLGEHIEAYSRNNPNNFRNNLHCGGESSPWDLTADQERFCGKIMTRAGFPYAHIDLLITPSGKTWLNEINLRGGLRGAKISQKEYLQAVESIQSAMLEQLLAG